MASNSITAPEPFDFKKPEEFEKWIKRFERYLTVTNTTSDAGKINTLVYCLGPQAEDILSTLTLSDEDAKKYDTVRDKYKDYFRVRKNVIFERARFNVRVQGSDESIESFLMDLYRLIENCEYGAMEADLLRDKIVVGVRDKKLSEHLQLDEKLTLEKCLAKVRAKELIEKQMSYLNTDATARADAVKSTRRAGAPKQAKKKPRQHGRRRTCFRCGNEPHAFDDCPAKAAKCSKCSRIGHWQKCCKTKTSLKEVREETESEDDDHFLGTVAVVGELAKDDFTIELNVNDAPVTFKIDSGADVTVIGHSVYKRIAKPPRLQNADKVLVSASGQPLNIVGMFQGELVNKNDVAKENIYVVKRLKHPLIGKPAISSLQLLKRTNAVGEQSYKDKIMGKFPKLFKGLGQFPGEHVIKLKPDATPFAINAPRRIAQPLLPKVKTCLDKMVANGVIRKLDTNEVSPYLSPIVVVPKSNGDVRVCVDYTELNKHVLRPRYELPTVDETLAKIGAGAVFTKLDANQGFFQIKLAEESQNLTSFLTPWGRYCSLRMPFGIASGSECYQDNINDAIGNSQNTACLIDDICISSPDRDSHEKYLFPVLQKLQDAGVTLNADKCEFMKESITFVGHTVSKDGVSADPDKIKAIREMPPPQSVGDVRRFMGMVNQLGKFSSKLAEKSAPIRALLSVKNAWYWGPEHKKAFDDVKAEICSDRVLAAYDPNYDTKIRSDSSKDGYGAVLLQRKSPNDDFRPVYFASKSLTPAEQNYSIIEKEAGAIVFACTKFEKFVLGMDNLKIETDQKPLVNLLGKKPINNLPPRIVRFRIALMRFAFTISHVPGKEMYLSDCLSRASIKDNTSTVLHKECEAYVNALLSNLPCTDRRLEQIKQTQHDDEICVKVMQYTQDGWPNRHELPAVLQPFHQFREDFSVCNGILMKNDRLVIPTCMRLEILDLLHVGHMGIERCRQRARVSVWWPNLSKQIEEMVKNCTVCARNAPDQAEPLMPTPLPDRPFQRVAADICELKGKKYLVIVDYYSKFIEFALLADMTSSTLIRHLKSMMSRHGIFETLVTDNQFATAEMTSFSNEWGFTHVTSSSRYPRSNGCAENAVKQFKSLLKKNGDPYLALLTYRATPQHNGLSPSEMCMGRRIRTQLPQAPRMLKPRDADVHEGIRQKDETYKAKMKINYDTRHRVKNLSPLRPGDNVQIRDKGEDAIVQAPAENAPRSYVIQTPQSTLRRNRRSLIKLPTPPQEQQISQENAAQRPTRMRKNVQRFGEPIPWNVVANK